MLTVSRSHIPIFASFITLSAGVLWFIDQESNAPLHGTEETHATGEEYFLLKTRALWNTGVSLAVILFGYTCIALLDIPLDPPRTTLVNNRLLRLAARPIYIIVILTVIVADDLDTYLYFGICGLGMSFMLLWEMIGSLERPARLIEPKGLTVLMKKEYRQERPSGEALRIAI